MKTPSQILPYLFLIPTLSIFLPFYVYPFVSSVWLSFLEEDGEVGIANYVTVFDAYGIDVAFSLGISVLSTFVSGLIGITAAFYFKISAGQRIKRLLNQVFRIPLFVPMVVVAQMMRTYLAPHGTLNTMFAQIGLVDLSSPLQLFDWRGLLIGFVWKQTPFMTLIILSGFLMIRDSYIEAARVAGAGHANILLRILLPMARANIAIAFILTFASNLSTFTLPYMLIGGAKPTTITVDMAHRVTLFGDWGTANALGVISYVMVGFFSVYYLREMTKRGIYER
ncbi:MAG: ABC transporter permease subunit [Candidatus Caldarchaeum sp.]|nr:ABC transporter permease subunit [Candidatus Caldarchaeum sp.]MDW8063281.1 ABC transporter permease subunit [Candidatus Caldarchaeum sp.]